MRTIRRAGRRAAIGLVPCVVGSIVGAVMMLPAPALAADHPVSARSLRIGQTSTGARLVFVSRDPALGVPAVGSADDPATGAPGGAVVEIFTQSGLSATLNVPAGLGNPGWKVRSGGRTTYVYRSPSPAVRKLILREERLLKIVSDDAGLDLGAPLGGVAIRITTGSLRNCAVFTSSTVRRDDPGRYLARDASAADLPDCSDASLLTPLQLGCNDKEDYPTCGGACPDGEECFATFYDEPIQAGCVCNPIGVTPCGSYSPDSCDGGTDACASGETCQSIRVDVGIDVCACVDPDQPCGPTEPGYCPPDSECQPLPGPGGYACIPTFCGGTYPACGGACDAGRNCVPAGDGVAVGICVCAAPENECEGLMCGGFSCPPGEACTLEPGTTACSCEPL